LMKNIGSVRISSRVKSIKLTNPERFELI